MLKETKFDSIYKSEKYHFYEIAENYFLKKYEIFFLFVYEMR